MYYVSNEYFTCTGIGTIFYCDWLNNIIIMYVLLEYQLQK